MKTLKVLLKKAQETKEYLISKDLLNHNYLLLKEKTYFYFPLKNTTLKKIKSFSVIEKKLTKKEKKRNFKEKLKEKLTKKELKKIKTSYDVVGDIAILEIVDELRKKKKIIAELLLNERKNVKTVLKKEEGRKGKYRLQKYKFLTGKRNYITEHRENNVKLKVNVKDVYFSPRLSNERKRIAKLVKKNESILVMFSGCAPYPIVISKNTNAKEIYGVEINPKGHKLGEENIKLNKLKNIKLFCGDVKIIIPKLKKKFDRVVMPFPKEGQDFLELAITTTKKNGTIHFYLFLKEKDIPKKAYDKIKSICNKLNKKYNILKYIKVGQFSPRTYRICVDFKIK